MLQPLMWGFKGSCTCTRAVQTSTARNARREVIEVVHCMQASREMDQVHMQPSTAQARPPCFCAGATRALAWNKIGT
eukprot:3993935-Prorocentrum_lima.AAC.1